MKNFIIFILAFVAIGLPPQADVRAAAGNVGTGPEGSGEISYLGVGNSFTWNSTEFLGKIAASQGRKLAYFVAGIGGATIEEQVRRIELFEANPADPAGHPYKRERQGLAPEYLSLRELLEERTWDIVSIQQRSGDSFSVETYEPYAEKLVSYIRKYAPNSEIVVHMTWAYREDHDWFISGERTQQEMYDGLAKAYQKLADTYGLRIVPIGAAMQEARKMKEWTFEFPDPDFNYDSAVYPNVPLQKGSLSRGWYWRENKDAGEFSFRKDSNHANSAGCYLGGLVHFEFLFGASVDIGTVFRLKGFSDAQVETLIEAAHRGVEAYRGHNSSISPNLVQEAKGKDDVVASADQMANIVNQLDVLYNGVAKNSEFIFLADHYASLRLLAQAYPPSEKTLKSLQEAISDSDPTGFLNGERQLVHAYHSLAGDSVSYVVYLLPKDWKAANEYPVYVWARGGGPDYYPNDIYKLYQNQIDKAGIPGATSGQFKTGFTVRPGALGGRAYAGKEAADFVEGLESFQKLYATEGKRYFLGGFSNGGKAAYLIGARTIEEFHWAAIGMCAPAVRDNLTATYAAPLRYTPIWLGVGEEDRLLPNVRALKSVFEEIGNPPKYYEEVEGLGHDWTWEFQKSMYQFFQDIK